MGVDYLYCGECRECLHEDDFSVCHYCLEPFEHPSNHGFYCIKCEDKCKPTRKTREHLFCSKDCLLAFKEQKQKEKEEKLKNKQVIEVKRKGDFTIPKKNTTS